MIVPELESPQNQTSKFSPRLFQTLRLFKGILKTLDLKGISEVIIPSPIVQKSYRTFLSDSSLSYQSVATLRASQIVPLRSPKEIILIGKEVVIYIIQIRFATIITSKNISFSFKIHLKFAFYFIVYLYLLNIKYYRNTHNLAHVYFCRDIHHYF